MISKSDIINTPMHGNNHLNILSGLMPPTPAATNKLIPTGGVHIPITKFTIIITAKCTGSTQMRLLYYSSMYQKSVWSKPAP